MCVSKCVCECVYVCMRQCLCVRVCMRVYVCVRVYVCACVCFCVCVWCISNSHKRRATRCRYTMERLDIYTVNTATRCNTPQHAATRGNIWLHVQHAFERLDVYSHTSHIEDCHSTLSRSARVLGSRDSHPPRKTLRSRTYSRGL